MQQELISHSVVTEDIEETVEQVKANIVATGDKEHVSVERLLGIVDQFAAFDFGRFLLQNRGINGYWTHYMLTHPWFGRKTGKNNRGESFSELETFILDRLPLMLATQERFEISLREIQKAVKSGANLACIPSGMMGEFFYLDFEGVDDIELVGIDYDPEALKDAEALAKERGLSKFTSLQQGDAWKINENNRFDLISSNGLTIYEPNRDRLVALYKNFYNALKSNGKLVSGFVTYPPVIKENSEWDMSAIDQEALLMQRILFVDVLEPRFQCFSSTEETEEQLREVGFSEVEFIYDKARMFPTVLATKL